MSKFADRTALGFTLIEMLIVVAFLGVFAAVATDTFTNIMRAQNKTRVVNELEQSGNYALSIMEQQIRDAERIICCGGDDYSGEGCSGVNRNDAVGIMLDGEAICFCAWNLAEGQAILRRMGTGCGGAGDYSFLTNTDPVTGVDVVTETESAWGTKFECDAEGKWATIRLELVPAPKSPARQDFQAGGGVTLETTVVVRGSYK